MPNSAPANLKELFKGNFLTEPEVILEKLLKIKAFVFDWDGVFNNGTKDASGSSPFNEVDSMGINMLRYNYFLRNGNNPVAAIISGEKNEASFTLGTREHFQSVYFKIKHKKEALDHLCRAQGIRPDEVAFFFDDILDLSIAELCGLRIMVGRTGSPMLTELVEDDGLADYITSNDGGNTAVREATELLMAITHTYRLTITNRVAWTESYQKYIAERNTIPTEFLTHSGTEIIRHLF